jgi:hypothetical protein
MGLSRLFARLRLAVFAACVFRAGLAPARNA